MPYRQYFGFLAVQKPYTLPGSWNIERLPAISQLFPIALKEPAN